eukprot:s3295_g6.t1
MSTIITVVVIMIVVVIRIIIVIAIISNRTAVGVRTVIAVLIVTFLASSMSVAIPLVMLLISSLSAIPLHYLCSRGLEPIKRACLIQCYYRCSGHSPVFPLHRLFG